MVPRAGPPDVDDDESKPSRRDFVYPQHSLHVLTILYNITLCHRYLHVSHRGSITVRGGGVTVQNTYIPRCGAGGRRSSLKIMQQLAVTIIRPDRPIAFPPAVRLYIRHRWRRRQRAASQIRSLSIYNVFSDVRICFNYIGTVLIQCNIVNNNYCT